MTARRRRLGLPVLVLAPGHVARYWARESGVDLRRVIALDANAPVRVRGLGALYVVHLPDWPPSALSADLRAALALLDALGALLPGPPPPDGSLACEADVLAHEARLDVVARRRRPTLWARIRGVLTARTRATVIGGHKA